MVQNANLVQHNTDRSINPRFRYCFTVGDNCFYEKKNQSSEADKDVSAKLKRNPQEERSRRSNRFEKYLQWRKRRILSKWGRGSSWIVQHLLKQRGLL